MTTASSGSDLSELLTQARGGRDDALAEVLERYRSYALLLGRLQIPAGLRNKVSASDLVQEAFIRARETFGGFRGTTEAELLAWLRRVLASQLARQLRHHHAQRRDARQEQQLEASMVRSSQAISRAFQASDTSPSQQAARREEAVILANALAAMPSEHREVLVLRHLEGQSFPAIARKMGRELENVKSLWRRALKQLRDHMNLSSD